MARGSAVVGGAASVARGAAVVEVVSGDEPSVLVGVVPAATGAGTRWANQVKAEVVWGWRAC
jgi:hypothetical protein